MITESVMWMAAEESNREMAQEDDETVVVPLSARRDPEEGMSHEAEDEVMQMILPWTPKARLVNQISIILSIAIPLCWLIAWPIGTITAAKAVTGVWSFAPGYSVDVIIWAATCGVMVRLIGFILSLALRLEASAQTLVQSAPRQEKRSDWQADELNDEIDRALERLADAERLIRQQVHAIGTVSEALTSDTSRSAEKLATERNALMTLTEEMNREADRFAERIAERTLAAAKESGGFTPPAPTVDEEFTSQLGRLEEVSARSLDRFEKLAQVLEQRHEELQQTHSSSDQQHGELAARLERNTAQIEAAQAAIADQSSKLQELIQDQRRRAERLAKAVSEQSERTLPLHNETPASKSEPTPVPLPLREKPPTPRGQTTWKDILAKVEEAKPAPLGQEEDKPIPSAPLATKTSADIAPKVAELDEETDDMDVLDRLVVRIQNYSLVIQTQLFGGPSHEDLDRFETGERQIFAKSLITRNPDELRTRIKAELNNNPVFRERTNEFLKDFDTILEPLSSEGSGADAIQTYLTSPLGRLYMLTGSATGHFD